MGSHTFRVLPGARPPTGEWRACAMMVFLAGAAVAKDPDVVTHEVYHMIESQEALITSRIARCRRNTTTSASRWT